MRRDPGFTLIEVMVAL
ncbi:MAG: prepilin-type N-terminal cleavage/methylation domain-containing protein, partial [Gemmatimonadales bacterium]